jgi:hypothetical protein
MHPPASGLSHSEKGGLYSLSEILFFSVLKLTTFWIMKWIGGAVGFTHQG